MKLDKELYSIDEVGKLFEVTKPTVYDWMNRRGLQWVRIGGRRRITRAAIEAFIKAGGQEGIASGDTMNGSIGMPGLVANV
jgi:excisionase family DNA binding protein